MLDATLRVRGCRGYVGDDGWVVGQTILPSPQKKKRFKNDVIKKKKSNTTRSHINPTKSSGISLAPAQTLTLAVSASVSLQGVITPRWACAPFLALEGQGSLEEEGTEGEEAVGREWRKRR